MEPNREHEDIRAILLENQRLLDENNQMLKKMHRNAVRHFWFNVAWIIFLVGLPILAFYKIAAPLANSMSTYGTVESQLNQLQELNNLSKDQR